MARYCKVCGSTQGLEVHHIIKRSQNPSLVHCKLNLIDLCYIHHRDHKKGVHHNKELEYKLKKQLQDKLEQLFINEYLSKEEVNEVLQINEKALNTLLKTLQRHNDKYVKEEVIRRILGRIY